MRFQVPQFIEVEDKIFGQLTLKQFIYLAGGGGLCFVIYVFFNSLILSLIPMAVVASLAVALAFFKMNNKPFVEIMEAAFKYYFGGKLYIWKKEDKLVQPKTAAEQAANEAKNFASITVPKISDSKLKDLTWSLDIKESIYNNKNQR